MEKLLLVDGNSLLFRAFYALPLLATPNGDYTNAVYGFAVMLKKLLEEEEPTRVLVAFDKARQTFRNQIFEDYKGTRKDTPTELVSQFALVREFLTLKGIEWLELAGYEADDLLGVYSRAAEEAGLPCVIVTGDRDALQLVSEKTQVCLTKKGIGEVERYAPADVEKKLGVRVDQVVDLKALMGDTSDNIPGVPGIGPKTAVKLLTEYQTLQGIYEHISEIKGKHVRDNLELYEDQAWMSRKLGEIVRELPLPISLECLKGKPADLAKLRKFYQRLELKRFLQDLEREAEAQAAQESFLTAQAGVEKTPVTAIETAEAWQAFLHRHEQTEEFGFWVQGDDRHPMKAQHMDLWIEADGEVAHAEKSMLAHLKAWLEDERKAKILYDAKYAQVVLRRQNLVLRGVRRDLLLLTYVQDPSFSGKKLHDKKLAEVLAFHQCLADETDFASQTLALRSVCRTAYAALPEKLRWLLDEMEQPVSEILGQMEWQGVRLNPWVLQEIGTELAQRIAQQQEDIYQLTGQEFNILSPAQLGKVLFEDMGLSANKKTKSGYSTSAEVLEKLQDVHPVAGMVLQYRKLTKLKSTYVDALPQMVHPQTGNVHTVFYQDLTATGRLSSVDPNLQNIPVRDEEGRRIRKAFVPSRPDWVLFSADYSQIDLRALAHISGDENLIRTFRDGVDIHTRTAAEIFGVEESEVDEELRRRAKAVNFGIVYGISGFGLAKNTGVSEKEARQYIKAYLHSYPKVEEYMEWVVEDGKKNGYVETIFGRRRYLPELNSHNKVIQANAKRIAWNTPVQGTSADIIKLAMIRTAQEAEKSNLRTHLLLQVHDELLFEVHEEDFAAWAQTVKDAMESVCTLKVPLEVTLKYGGNWYELQKLAQK